MPRSNKTPVTNRSKRERRPRPGMYDLLLGNSAGMTPELTHDLLTRRFRFSSEEALRMMDRWGAGIVCATATFEVAESHRMLASNWLAENGCRDARLSVQISGRTERR